jgi:superfamily II helicase
MITKQCKHCSQEKLVTEFTPQIGTRDGLKPICRDCSSIAAREYYLNHSNRIKTKAKEWKQKQARRKTVEQ